MKKSLLLLISMMVGSHQAVGMSMITEIMNNTNYEVVISYGFPSPRYGVVKCLDLNDVSIELNSSQTDHGIFLPPQSRTVLFGAGIPINDVNAPKDCVMVCLAWDYNKLVIPVYCFWQYEDTIYTGFTRKKAIRTLYSQQSKKSHSLTLLITQEEDDLLAKTVDSDKYTISYGSLSIGLLFQTNPGYSAFEPAT